MKHDPLISKPLGWVLVLFMMIACQDECPDNEIVGEAQLTSATKQIVAFTNNKALTYTNAAGDQLHLTRYDGAEGNNDRSFTTIVQTCQEGWLDQSSIALYTERVEALYQSEEASIYTTAQIRPILQPNPYDTVLVDLLSVSIDKGQTNQRSSRIDVFTSQRGNNIKASVLDSVAIIADPYHVVADTVLLGVSMTGVYYAVDELTNDEIFVTAEQGVAAFRVDSTLWVRK